MGLLDYTCLIKPQSGDGGVHNEVNGADAWTGTAPTLVDLGGGDYVWRFNNLAGYLDTAQKTLGATGTTPGGGVTIAIQVAITTYPTGSDIRLLNYGANTDPTSTGLQLRKSTANNLVYSAFREASTTAITGANVTVGTTMFTAVMRLRCNDAGADYVDRWNTGGGSTTAPDNTASGNLASNFLLRYLHLNFGNSAVADVRRVVVWGEELSDADCDAVRDDIDAALTSVADTTPPDITSTGTGSTNGPFAANVAENSTAAFITLTANENVTWGALGGADAALFQKGTETATTLQIRALAAFNFESLPHANPFVVTVTATDGFGNARTVTVNATVTNVNEPPGAPTGVTATAGNASASVAFTPPADNGGPTPTNFIVTSTPGSITAEGASSPIVVSGLTNGVEHTFVVNAENSEGVGPASAASNAVTPAENPVITGQPSNATVKRGQTATFTTAATGSGTVTYQWQRNPGGVGSWADISGATSASYTTPATTISGGSANDQDDYRCNVSDDDAGPVATDVVTLTVQQCVLDISGDEYAVGDGNSPATMSVAGSYVWKVNVHDYTSDSLGDSAQVYQNASVTAGTNGKLANIGDDDLIFGQWYLLTIRRTTGQLVLSAAIQAS